MPNSVYLFHTIEFGVSSSCRLIELNYLLLIELIPLQQKYMSHNPSGFEAYALPPSILSLYETALEVRKSDSGLINKDMEIEEIDDTMIAQ